MRLQQVGRDGPWFWSCVAPSAFVFLFWSSLCCVLAQMSGQSLSTQLVCSCVIQASTFTDSVPHLAYPKHILWIVGGARKVKGSTKNSSNFSLTPRPTLREAERAVSPRARVPEERPASPFVLVLHIPGSRGSNQQETKLLETNRGLAPSAQKQERKDPAP